MTYRSKNYIRMGVGTGVITFGLLGFSQTADTSDFTIHAWMIQVVILIGGALIFWGTFRQRLIQQEESNKKLTERCDGMATKREMDLMGARLDDVNRRLGDLLTIRTQELQDLRSQLLEMQREYRQGFKEQDEARHDMRNKEFTPMITALELRWEQRFSTVERRHA